MALIAKGRLSHVIGLSCFRMVGLSPNALFFPGINLVHFLELKHQYYSWLLINALTLQKVNKVP